VSIAVTIHQIGHLMPSIDAAIAGGLDGTYCDALADESRPRSGVDRLPYV
jgi:hypothetical protein